MRNLNSYMYLENEEAIQRFFSVFLFSITDVI